MWYADISFSILWFGQCNKAILGVLFFFFNPIASHHLLFVCLFAFCVFFFKGAESYTAAQAVLGCTGVQAGLKHVAVLHLLSPGLGWQEWVPPDLCIHLALGYLVLVRQQLVFTITDILLSLLTVRDSPLKSPDCLLITGWALAAILEKIRQVTYMSTDVSS